MGTKKKVSLVEKIEVRSTDGWKKKLRDDMKQLEKDREKFRKAKRTIPVCRTYAELKQQLEADKEVFQKIQNVGRFHYIPSKNIK